MYVRTHARTGHAGTYHLGCAGGQERGAVMWPVYAHARTGYAPMYKEDARKAKGKSSSTTTSTTPCDQVPRRTATMLLKKFEAIQATPTMQVRL